MKALLILFIPVFVLTACESTKPDFRRMSEEELLAYNASVPTLDQVFCETVSNTASRIPRRTCITVRDRLAGVTHIGRLESPSSNTSYSQ